MFIPQGRDGESDGRHGGRKVSLAELRCRLDRPSSLDDGHRQRLLDLAQCLARVQALGDDFGRVKFSRDASAALRASATPV
jgi:hypothetical protein